MDIKEYLFHYADFIYKENGSDDIPFRGFLYRRKCTCERKLLEGGVRKMDDEVVLVADDCSLKKGDIIKYGENRYYLNELSPLCVMDKNSGVTASVIKIP